MYVLVDLPVIPQPPSVRAPVLWRICRALLFLLPPEQTHRISVFVLSLRDRHRG